MKIGDFRVATAGDSSGLTGPLVAFPGAKDVGAKSNFRDSKFEIHPLLAHIWNLFELQRNHLRQLFATHLDVELSDAELHALPDFTTSTRIREAISHLTNHYGLAWRDNLSHRQFHLLPKRISMFSGRLRKKRRYKLAVRKTCSCLSTFQPIFCLYRTASTGVMHERLRCLKDGANHPVHAEEEAVSTA